MTLTNGAVDAFLAVMEASFRVAVAVVCVNLERSRIYLASFSVSVNRSIIQVERVSRVPCLRDSVT